MFLNIKEDLADIREEAKNHPPTRYVVLQSFILLVALGVIIMFDDFFGKIIVASLGASSFILFATPLTKSSRSVVLIGSYIFGASSGILFNLLHANIPSLDSEQIRYALVLACACAAAVATFLMAKAGFAHPPAAALAIGVTSGINPVQTGIAAVLSVLLLCVIRNILKKHLRNLV
jgi:small-conductance mechanosensitive channel